MNINCRKVGKSDGGTFIKLQINLVTYLIIRSIDKRGVA